jgi:hypothetical protein
LDLSDGTLINNGTLTQGSSNYVVLQGGGTFTNNGTIDQTNTGYLNISGSGSVDTTLINSSGSTIDFQGDNGIGPGPPPGGAVIKNAGTIEKTGGTGTSVIAQPLINTGTLDAASSILQLYTNTTATGGTYEAAAGATLELTDGQTFSETGAFTAAGPGTITLNGGTFSVYNNAATLSIASTTSFVWPGSAIDVPTADTLTVNGNLLFNGTSSEVLEGDGTMTENGTITQSGTGNLVIAGTSTVAPTLVIPAGSIYNFAANSGIVHGGNGGVLTNSGTIEKTAGGASSPINVTFNNTGGTLNVTNGTLTLNTLGGENSGGTFDVSAGAILDLTGGNTVTYSGTYTGSGTGQVELGSGTLSISGGTNGATFDLPGNLFVWSGGAIDTNGTTMTIEGNVKINSVNGNEDLNSGNSSGGYLNIGGSSTGILNDVAAGNTLNIDSGTTLLITRNGTVNLADVTVRGGGAISNLGNLNKTLGTSGATISTYVDNEKNVEVKAGTLTFSGTVDQVFNNQLTGGSWTALGASANAVLNISSASFTTIDPGVTVVLNGPFASFANLSALTTNEGSLSLLGGASLATTGNFTNAGTLTLTPSQTLDSVLTVNGTLRQTGLGTLSISLGGTTTAPTFGGISSTGAVALAGSLKVTSTVMPNIGSSFDILANSSGSAVSGDFSGLSEGTTFTVKDGTNLMTFRITYAGGGSRHDVVITRTS